MQQINDRFREIRKLFGITIGRVRSPTPTLGRTRTRLFHGWWMVLVSALGLFLGPIPIVVLSFGVFLKPLSQEFHAGRGAITFALTLQNTILACGLPLTGRLIDRLGASEVILRSTFGSGLVLVAASFCGASLWQLYLFYSAVGLATCGITAVSYSDVISHWFDRSRGLALGLMMLGIGIGAFIVPSVGQALIERFGWRLTFAMFGVAMLVITVPILSLFLEDRPESKGLLPDGSPFPNQTSRRLDSDEGLCWTEARRTSTFWVLFCATIVISAAVLGCFAHLASILGDRGSRAQTAAFATSLYGLGLLVGRTGTGYLLDRFFAPRVAAIIFSAAAAGIVLLRFANSEEPAFIAAFFIGLGLGSEGDIMAYLTSRYFGLRCFGTIYGIIFAGFGFAGGLGPYLIGMAFDASGSYAGSLNVCCLFVVIGAVLMIGLGPYRYQRPPINGGEPALNMPLAET